MKIEGWDPHRPLATPMPAFFQLLLITDSQCPEVLFIHCVTTWEAE